MIGRDRGQKEHSVLLQLIFYMICSIFKRVGHIGRGALNRIYTDKIKR